MLVSKALLGMTCFNLLPRVILAGDVCQSDCPDPFPPGHHYIGDAWWAIGNEASGAYITDITTTLEVPPKPDGVKGGQFCEYLDCCACSTMLYEVLDWPQALADKW